jgi:hypothetical protein
MILSDQNFVKILAPKLEEVFNARMDWLEEWDLILRLPLAKKLVGCRGPDFGYFRGLDRGRSTKMRRLWVGVVGVNWFRRICPAPTNKRIKWIS